MIDPSIARAVSTSTWTLLVFGIILQISGKQLHLPGCELAALFAFLGFLGSAMVQFMLRVFQLEADAVAEFQRLNQSRKVDGDQSLFQTSEDNIQSRRVRQQVERIGLPVFAGIFLILQAVLGWWMWKSTGKPWVWDPAAKTIGLAICGATSMVSFLLGRFMAGLARGSAERWLRLSASYLVWVSVICFLNGLTLVAAWVGFDGLDRYLVKGLIVILWVNAFETGLGMVFEIYRPRRDGEMVRFLFESRLMSFLSHPGGFFATAAQAIDYQFGFKVSETWFYRYLERALGWMILVQLALFWMSTAVLVIDPEEQVLIERWGRSTQKNNGLLEPGLHLKWPWPMEKAYRFDTRLVKRMVLGPPLAPEVENQPTRLWSDNALLVEDYLLVASNDSQPTGPESGQSAIVPVNLLSARIPMQYFIRDIRQWALEHSDPEALLESIAQREISAYFINVDFNDILIQGRLEAGVALKSLIQKAADELQLGVEIIHLSLHEIQPPQSIAPEFEAVIGAAQQKETMVLEAQAYAAGELPRAQAEASRLSDQAFARKLSILSEARGRAAAFEDRLKAYGASPGVYLSRSHMEALARGMAGVRKFLVLTTNRASQVEINLEQKINQDLLNLDLDKNKTPSRNTAQTP